jgi:NitT/TauT family transport system permease protein
MRAHEQASLQSPTTVPMSSAALLLQAKRRRQLRRVPYMRLLIVVGFLGLWELGTRIPTGEGRLLIEPFIWAQPSKIAVRLWQWSTDGTIFRNIGFTLFEAVTGFSLGMLAGVAAGFGLGRSDFWARVFKPMLQVANAIPRIMFAPLFFIIFGLDEGSKIALVTLVIFFIAFWNAFNGVREVDRNVYNNALMLGASGRQMMRHVLLPSALVWIMSSLHLAVGFAVSAAIVGEYLGATKGLGFVIARSQGNFDQTGVLAGLIALSTFVVAVELVVTAMERRLWKWKPAPAGELQL